MAGTRTFAITGSDEIVAQLKAIDSSIRNEAAFKAVSAAAGVVKRAASWKAPVYRGSARKSYYRYGRRPGELAESIFVKTVGLYTGNVIGYIIVRDNIGHLKEFGHKTKKGKKLVRNALSRFRKARFKADAKSEVAAQEYMRPAIDQSQGAMLEAMAIQIQKTLYRNAKAALGPRVRV